MQRSRALGTINGIFFYGARPLAVEYGRTSSPLAVAGIAPGLLYISVEQRFNNGGWSLVVGGSDC